MKFRVPSSSSSPHRPQLRTSSATRRKSFMLAMSRPSRRKFSGGCQLSIRLFCHGAAVHPDHLARDVTRRRAVEEHQHARLLRWPGDAAQWGPEGVKELLAVGPPQLVED